ncbi:PREDICTED: glyoxylate/hydroxypyruvate reductase HPR3-like [Nicotiana attenuata]|uniref:Glyoxylatehydroxypyruvate reductase hpr3 n=1 Tax=Nicotiana attenuata TaxID=49451 RepID=A0A1J6JXM5_NICAT|nr:PREDICTED: glyoxylate/hydroxypyruvate reductase HPR3-like [Nicotiana attenuata]OIT21862.1 glyoxylatehydroxypyruvate reductase hpr3 [Nicotiana attenuata]
MELPELLVIHPPPVFIIHQQQFSQKFKLLKAYESPLSTELFLQAHAQSTKALICYGKSPITSDILRRLPSLQLVVTGFNHIDLPECRRRCIAVANTADVFSEDTADIGVGLLIDLLRKISSGDRFVRSGIWPKSIRYPLGSRLGGKHVGIVGLGNIGLKVAKRLEAFGCKISYNSRQKKPVHYNFYPNVCELAFNCNILVICCTLTLETRHMIDKDVLKALGKDGILINIARGPIVDEKELVKFLVDGEIAGAGLDVFENEPKVPQELIELDNVVLTPHRAAFTKEAFRDAFQLVLANLEAFFLNKPLISPVID